ncbi:hypothetical protein [Mesorhizobium sp.]|uniref:hypothetical protein n=1 Tax=Mesorhizobium sp. TaxID=1871066 RepID=UPI000FE78760|nr:hypothetical protein [Mesorhizobium sp.]RWI07397.1 MAG: hypothetical protein EOQ90_24350 [Mesorhizobium sp.]RWK46749.1 MAG: hypothetical protein EOR48_33025 [Mesorhizobium sp.]RWK95248.1 MAG: hypothetical protein EOR53_14785 [Mesorhizobium sp.]RWL13037.1 MAG: hypothetical protein EOR57_33625 [Mesorhizobium sp.]TIP39643.1 MAG: hypothetical protein E5X62_30705 [Mesorhizobium sp.]
MKQQRPFVVEIKQKRGLVNRPQSIWAGIDLAAITNDIAEGNTKGTAEAPIFPCEDIPSRPTAAIDEAVPDVKDVTTPDVSLPKPPRVEEAPIPEASNAPTEGRRTRKKKRWQKDVSLRPGERWKRRLPWVLRHNRAAR